ncbi:hypothetical protein VPH35_119832 [Triticum aestivum]
MRTTKGREESRVTDAAGPRLFRAKKVRLAPPGAPARRVRPVSAGAVFGSGQRKSGSWGRDWTDFSAPAQEKRLGRPSWGAAGDALSTHARLLALALAAYMWTHTHTLGMTTGHANWQSRGGTQHRCDTLTT